MDATASPLPKFSSASEYLEAFWDGDLPVPVVRLAKKSGIRVFSSASMPASGMCYLDEDGPRIIINANEPEVRRRFTTAHEIGHVALGHLDSKTPMFRDDASVFLTRSSDPREVQANRFAAQLLMPKSAVQVAIESMKISTVEGLAELFDVSVQAMRIRLKNLGFVK